MILGATVAGIFWIVMAFSSNAYMPLLVASIFMNVATVFASTVMGGLMVEAGQAFAAPGRISALRQFVQSVAGIGAPVLGGWLAGKAFGWTATTTIAAITVLSLAVLTFFVLHERPAQQVVSGDTMGLSHPDYRVPTGMIVGIALAVALAIGLALPAETRQIGFSFFALIGMFLLILLIIWLPVYNPTLIKAQNQLVQILRSRTLWMAAFMLLLVYTVPGLGTALTYRQEDVLKFPKPFIGLMDSIGGGLGVVGAVLYAWYCRKFNLRVLLVAAIAANAAATLLYLIYTKGTAPFVHGLGGLVGVASELALMDLAVRSTPVGCEALGFSLMMSVRNFGLALSDVLGSKMLDDLHMSFNTLVLINAGTTAVILLFVPLLPRAIMSRRDADPSEAEIARGATTIPAQGLGEARE